MDDVLCDFQKAHKNAIQLNPKIQFPQSQYGFFRNLEPIPGGIETVNRLNASEKFSVYILTAPSIKNPLCYTEKRLWIEDHFGIEMVNWLIISPNKGLNKGEYLIDDNNQGKGQENFEGKLLHFGSKDFKGWSQILDYFEEKYDLI
jgi:5'(3')-deoxyribonucleotidase